MRSTLSCLVLVAAAGTASAQDFEPAVRILAAGEAIDTEVGHAAPFMADWDGDGLPDLLVGQFGQGLLRIYRNVGTRPDPEFEQGQPFKEGSPDGRVPTG